MYRGENLVHGYSCTHACIEERRKLGDEEKVLIVKS